ncbi:MAG: RNA polymerase sigma factor [Gammaproteobacteria bacterium]
MRSLLVAQLDRLVNYALYMSHDRENARDLVQSCVVKALAAKRVPTDERAYKAWLFKILRNIFLDNLRKQATDNNILRDLMENSAFDGNNLRESHVYTIEQRKINILSVHEGLEKLNPGQREILVLIDMAGFSYREAAEILQLPIGTVMSRLSRSRNALLREMDEIKIGPVSVPATGMPATGMPATGKSK